MCASPAAPCGRGRGRGLLKFVNSKPGQQEEAPPAAVPLTPIHHVISLVNALSLEPDQYEVIAVLDAITKLAVNTDGLKSTVDILLKRCESDWHFSKSAVSCVFSCSKVEALKPIRGEFLKTLHALYKQKEKICVETPPNRWLSCVALLCQALVQMPNPDQTPMKILVTPVFEVLEFCMAPTASAAELECASIQLVDIGHTLLKHCDGPQLKALINLIRDRITKGSGSKEARLRLIDAIERFAANWETPESALPTNISVPNPAIV